MTEQCTSLTMLLTRHRLYAIACRWTAADANEGGRQNVRVRTSL